MKLRFSYEERLVLELLNSFFFPPSMVVQPFAPWVLFQLLNPIHRSRDSTVSIAIGYGLDDKWFGV
jgi:hypothetical protein